MVASQNEHKLWSFVREQVNVLENGVGGPTIPLPNQALLWWHR